MIDQERIDWLIFDLQTSEERRSVIFTGAYKDRERVFDDLASAGFDATLSVQSWIAGEHDHLVIGEGGAIGWHAPGDGVHLYLLEPPRSPELDLQLRARLT